MSDTPAAGTMTEDYVKVIYKSREWAGEGLTTNELAATLGVAASSVSGNLKKLARDGFIDYEPYGRATLTEVGQALAVQVVRRHRLIETYLVEQHGYGWDEVHDEAEVLEHAISDRLLARIDEELGFPDHDPHGDPIPRPDGTITHPRGTRLDELGVGECGVVVRVSDHDPALLRYLDTLAVAVGTHVRVEAVHDFGGSVSLALFGPAGSSADGEPADGQPADGQPADGEPAPVVELATVAATAIWVAAEADGHRH